MATLNVTNRAGEQSQVEAKPGATLMEILRDNDLDVEAICGGCCSCATCHIFVDAAWADKLPPLSEDEKELVEETESYQPNSSRLSCQVTMTEELDGLTIVVAPEE